MSSSSGSSITGEDDIDVNTPGVAVDCSLGRAAIDGDGGTSATRELDDDELLVPHEGITRTA